ncbi:MAG: SDR family oxidoreductase [Bacteroidales bacterium]|nr:SDR family oxidoreductase [Bacteroidales bacterium]MCF8402899.1 SDR family oxidoreductase [Bacteroidales bacterium]
MNIIVTGASKGLGFEIVKAFSAISNHRIIAIARNEGQLIKLQSDCASINPQAHIIPFSFDLENFDTKKLKDFLTQNKITQVDVLINNAGLLIVKPFQKLSDSDFDKLFNINLKSIFKLTRDLMDIMPQRAHILNISSMGGFQGSAKFPGLSLYSASKGGLAILSECMAEEFKDRGIAVNCLAIGAVQTDMLAMAFPGYKAPLNPDEMAKFITDFALHGHRFFNGKILPVSLSTP